MGPGQAGPVAHLKAAGKVLHFGVSNHTPVQLAILHKRHPLVGNPVEFSPLHRQALTDGTLVQCQDLGLRPMVWSPLARGRLFTATDVQAHGAHALLAELGAQQGVSAATTACAWILRHPSKPLPITGTCRINGSREAMAAVAVTLRVEDGYRVWQASVGHGVP
jgi:predicted oxidoreductase